MQMKRNSMLAVALLAPLTMLAAASEQTNLKTFTISDATISKEFVVTNDAWLANPAKAQVLRLFEVPPPSVDKCMVIFRAKLKTEDLDGQAFRPGQQLVIPADDAAREVPRDVDDPRPAGSGQRVSH